MVEEVLNVLPNAKVGHIGLYRNEETLQPVRYYYKAPSDVANREVILLDPMLATCGALCDAITTLKQDGVTKIRAICILAAPQGLAKLNEIHPEVEVYCASLDSYLNEEGYIVPGLGDAGDRIFGIK